MCGALRDFSEAANSEYARGARRAACDGSGCYCLLVGHGYLRGLVDPRKSGHAASLVADIAAYALSLRDYSARWSGTHRQRPPAQIPGLSALMIL